MRVLIAPDKFKGTLTAHEAARAIAHGWKRARPKDVLKMFPISDGGDGFGSVLADLRGAKAARALAVDAAGRRCLVRWWWDAATATAIVESARVVGLAMLPPGKFHPFQLDTRGLGMVLRAVAKRGARRCVLGIGGSATNDGGFGLARELGWKFLDARDKPIQEWIGLAALARIEPPRQRTWPEHITVAVDVQNRLLGPRGCTRVFGPQKGLRPRDFVKAEAALAQLAKVARAQLDADCAAANGSGAAGGLGFGLLAFVGAQLTPGFELIVRAAKLDARLRRADLVITGEGRLDRSSLMGKGVGELAARCRQQGLPCFGLGGDVADLPLLAKRFRHLGALTQLTSVNQARAKANRWLAELASKVAQQFPQA